MYPASVSGTDHDLPTLFHFLSWEDRQVARWPMIRRWICNAAQMLRPTNLFYTVRVLAFLFSHPLLFIHDEVEGSDGIKASNLNKAFAFSKFAESWCHQISQRLVIGSFVVYDIYRCCLCFQLVAPPRCTKSSAYMWAIIVDKASCTWLKSWFPINFYFFSLSICFFLKSFYICNPVTNE